MMHACRLHAGALGAFASAQVHTKREATVPEARILLCMRVEVQRCNVVGGRRPCRKPDAHVVEVPDPRPAGTAEQPIAANPIGTTDELFAWILWKPHAHTDEECSTRAMHLKTDSAKTKRKRAAQDGNRTRMIAFAR